MQSEIISTQAISAFRDRIPLPLPEAWSGAGNDEPDLIEIAREIQGAGLDELGPLLARHDEAFARLVPVARMRVAVSVYRKIAQVEPGEREARFQAVMLHADEGEESGSGGRRGAGRLLLIEEIRRFINESFVPFHAERHVSGPNVTAVHEVAQESRPALGMG